MNEMYVLIVLDNGALVISTFRHYISLDNGHYDFRHLDTKVVDIWFPNQLCKWQNRGSVAGMHYYVGNMF